MVESRKRHAKKSRRPSVKGFARIIVYGFPRCVAFNVLLEDLERRRIPYLARDISRDREARVALAKLTKGNLSVPAVQIGGRILRNPQWTDLVAALAIGPLEDAGSDKRDLSRSGR